MNKLNKCHKIQCCQSTATANVTAQWISEWNGIIGNGAGGENLPMLLTSCIFKCPEMDFFFQSFSPSYLQAVQESNEVHSLVCHSLFVDRNIQPLPLTEEGCDQEYAPGEISAGESAHKGGCTVLLLPWCMRFHSKKRFHSKDWAPLWHPSHQSRLPCYSSLYKWFTAERQTECVWEEQIKSDELYLCY